MPLLPLLLLSLISNVVLIVALFLIRAHLKSALGFIESEGNGEECASADGASQTVPLLHV